MNPAAVWAAGISFLVCLAVHVALWRYGKIRSIPVLFAILLGPAVLALAAAACAPRGLVPWSPLLGALLGHVALSCAYIQTYPGLTGIPPTLRLVLLVADSGPRGATLEELGNRLGTHQLVREIFDPLVAGRLLIPDQKSGRLTISPRGRALIRPFALLRAWLGLPPGDG